MLLLFVTALFATALGHSHIGHDVGSQQAHMHDAAHDPTFDHEAFLGHDQAMEYAELTPEQSKARLAKLLPKIDSNNDSNIDKAELKAHISAMAKAYVEKDVDRSWGEYMKKGKDDKLTWAEYTKTMTGKEEIEQMDPVYQQAMLRDKARWPLADQNRDHTLDRTEFTCLLHPEDCPHMHGVLVDEHMREMDADGDGKITFKEYVADVYYPTEDELVDGQEPEWMIGEKQNFDMYRDVDKDGTLGRDEIIAWMYPKDYDAPDVEAAHLISMADDNEDATLSYEEVLAHYDVFVGSQATQYGQQLHDPNEL